MDDRPTCQSELQSNASWTRASRNFNISKESAFRQSNRVLDSVLKRKRSCAMRKLLSTRDYIPMLDEHCMGEAIETYFANLHVIETNHALKLMLCTFQVTAHFCLRQQRGSKL